MENVVWSSKGKCAKRRNCNQGLKLMSPFKNSLNVYIFVQIHLILIEILIKIGHSLDLQNGVYSLIS